MRLTFEARHARHADWKRRVAFSMHNSANIVTMTTITLNGTPPLGRLLQMFRQMAELDQTEMGELIHASRATISAWERDEREPSFTQVVAWARITGQPLQALVEAAERATSYGSEG